MELSTHFRGLLSRIEPGAAYVRDAKASHEKIRRELTTDSESGDACLDTFLSGSYARHTAIKDIKDVDVICVVDIDVHADEPGSEPGVVLSWLASVLLRYYDKVRVQGRSVRVIAKNDVHLDVVPGSPQSDKNGPLWIPDRSAGEWVEANPKAQNSFATNKNKATGGYFVQVVKLLKFWRDRIPLVGARPKSYVLETLVAEAIGQTPPSSHAVAVVDVLEGIWRRYAAWVNTGRVPKVSDPGSPGNSVTKRWDAKEFDAFMAEVNRAADTARDACESDDQSRSVKLWRSLFGNSFAPVE